MIERFVPKEYRDLLDFVSPAAFKVIDWKSLLGDFRAVSKSLFDEEAAAMLLRENQPLLLPAVTMSAEPIDGEDVAKTARTGQLILDVYFSQFFSRQGMFLDLRLSRFQRAGRDIVWSPQRLRYRFAEPFRLGMLDIYAGYYFNEPEQMRAGMVSAGLIDGDTSQAGFEETIDLLFAHFGEASNSKVKFDLASFRESFHSLFLHLKTHDITLPSDFLFLGVYLVTLYWGLEQIGVGLDVQKAFQESWQRNHA